MSLSLERRAGRRRTALFLATAASAAALLAGCGSSGTSAAADSSMSSDMSSGSAAGASSSAALTIHVSNFDYKTPASVAPGATVTVMNMDGVKHTVTADTGHAFDVSVDGGGSGTFTAPMKPGSYPFHCTFHSNMHGTLVVK